MSLALGTFLGLVTGLATPDAPAISTRAFALDQSVGLQTTETGLVGLGPDYRILFEPGGWRYDAALGREAPRTASLGFRLESVRVGEQPVLDELSATPEPEGTTAVYTHAGGIQERYAVRLEGVEQSFVFPELPAERGELVVRGRLATDLELVESDPDTGLRYALGDHGGIAFGGVTGIDADGRSARGTVRLDGDRVELRLPEEFVSDARLPLVLDPLISTFGVVVDSLHLQANPDVAQADGVYLVVFEHLLSNGDFDIRGQQFDLNGAPTGTPSVFGFLQQNLRETHPAVGVYHGTSGARFLVAWELGATGAPKDVYARLAEPGGVIGCGSNLLFVGTTPSTETELDVGVSWGDAHVLWEHAGQGIRGAVLGNVPGGSSCSLQVEDLYWFSTDPLDVSPELSDSPQQAPFHFATWARDEPGLGSDVYARRWLGAAPPATAEEILIYDSGFDRGARNPSCAASSPSDWMFVWEESDPDAIGIQYNVRGGRLVYPSGGAAHVVLPSFDVEDDVDELEWSPVIEYADDSYLVAYQELGSSSANTRNVVESLDRMSGGSIERVIVQSSSIAGTPALAAANLTFGGGEFFAVWSRQPPLFTPASLYGARVSSFEGAEFEENGGTCARGTSQASTAVSPNPGHRVELWNGDPNALVWLALSWSDATLVLGDALINLDVANSVVFPAGATDGLGWAGLDLPLPSGLIGISLWYQWFFLPTVSFPACIPGTGLSLSDGTRIVLG